MSTPITPTDGHDRELAVAERERNVLIDAGAGTGKTTIVVRRLVELVAPKDDGRALAMDRIGAITFTRRAAGELRLRIRGALLRELALPSVTALRRARLRAALSSIDAAYIGTIHSFADRLLRMRPSAARLGPSYEVVDDRRALIAETSRLLLHGAARGTLAEHVGDDIDAELVCEAQRCVADALAIGLRPIHREHEFYIEHGIDSFVQGLVERRDVDVPIPAAWTPDGAELQSACRELVRVGSAANGNSRAAAWLRGLAARASSADTGDLCSLYSDIAAEIFERRRASRKFNKRDDCGGDAEIWRLWNRIDRADAGRSALGDDVTRPLHRWMATRLLRMRPAVLGLYERVKQRHGVLDEIDLLLLLRNLMRDDLQSRGFYQRKFDHVFVDEFQDTDPLQSEILMYLAEAEPMARCIDDVAVAAGRITIVGDPQQSIYRFRRADVATYADVTVRLATDALRVGLTVNFRAVPGLIVWGNDRFRRMFDGVPPGSRFDVGRGRVQHRDLDVGRSDDAEPCVHIVPLAGESRLDAAASRAAEAAALPHYLRWLTERSGLTIVDPVSGERRPVAWGDICVLAMSTIHLPELFERLDAHDIPYTPSGGTLFLRDPLQQQLVLALRALADPLDGPAAAALRRPPFFSVDLGDLLRARADVEAGPAPEMEAMILELRRRRFDRPPGETARALLEQTCFGAAVALGPSGAGRLARLRELCHIADLIAFTESCDYDAVTARMRRWIDEPEAIDAPPPVLARAVRVMTIHQAKGSEFPVVVLWDARASAQSPMNPAAWQVTRDGEQWLVSLDGLRASHPESADLAGAEQRLLTEERRRLSYVAVTRARDLLVVPHAGDPGEMLLWRPLSETTDHPAVRVLDPYVVGRGASWADDEPRPAASELVVDDVVERDAAEAWASARRMSRPLLVPIAVTSRAHDSVGDSPASTLFERAGRFGSVFGTAVHRAIGLVLAGDADANRAATTCAIASALDDVLAAELVGDVERAAARLAALGMRECDSIRLEYPVAGVDDDGALLVGAIDLVCILGEELWIIDFKSDSPPHASAEHELPAYARQVRLYGRLLDRAGLAAGRVIRLALLFTADGSLHEV